MKRLALFLISAATILSSNPIFAAACSVQASGGFFWVRKGAEDVQGSVHAAEAGKLRDQMISEGSCSKQKTIANCSIEPGEDGTFVVYQGHAVAGTTVDAQSALELKNELVRIVACK